MSVLCGTIALGRLWKAADNVMVGWQDGAMVSLPPVRSVTGSLAPDAAGSPAPDAVGSPVGRPVVLVLMGVSGCGKSTVASLLAGALGWSFEEGDSLHPEANVHKMATGQPLTDDDRWPWLAKVADWVEETLDDGRNGIISCSALKRSYRDAINRRGSGVVFVFLSGSRETIAARLAVRRGHFMPTSLLDSQFADLEEPSPDEPELRINVGPAPGQIAREIIDELGLNGSVGEGNHFP
ncbi:gluconokinase, GntK/IdnK-type [Arthrobacter sp. H14-L1]|uniref:gluconokinase n=1 Tax=Arthrobacter sp. H14-L1 TaxID=2996697 RepID=UPI002D1E472C|nr:gluconokinase, GntK/IdnK-type [Arthrobacter sp. H14-L1]